MAREIQGLISLDSFVLIEYFRKQKKEKSFFFNLSNKYFPGFTVSVMVHHEIYKGATAEQVDYWNNLFQDLIIIPYTQVIDIKSLQIQNQLKKNRKLIQLPDLIIAATAVHHAFPLATLNEKHFQNIEGLNLITPSSFLP